MLRYDTVETGITEVTSIRRRKNREKSTWRAHRYFVEFESRIHFEISTWNQCHNFQFPREFAFQNRNSFDELSSWNFDFKLMTNRRRCVHWVVLLNLF